MLNHSNQGGNERDVKIPRKPVSSRLGQMALFAFFIVGGACSFLLYQTLEEKERNSLAAEFQHRAHERVLAIQQEFNTSMAIVESLSTFPTTAQAPSQKLFRVWTAPVLARYLGLQALSYNPIIKQADRAAFEEKLQMEHGAGAGIRELSPDGKFISALERDKYVAVQFIEPFEVNAPAVGLDVYSEPIRREAIRRALAGSVISATGPITLVQETETQKGLLVFAPAYALPDESGLRSIEGLMVGVFRVGELVEAALARLEKLDIDFVLYDVTEGRPGELLHQSGKEPTRNFRFLPTQYFGLEFAGRQWLVKAWPDPAFASSHRTLVPAAVLLTCFLFIFLILAYMNRRMELNRIIYESDYRFRQMAEHISEMFWIMDPLKKVVTYMSPASETIYGQAVDKAGSHARPLPEKIHPKDRERMIKAAERQCDGELTDEEFRVILPNGRMRWIRERGFPVFDPEGNVELVTGITGDISIQKLDETERERLQDTFFKE